VLFSFIVLAFRGFLPWEVISGRSLRYSVRFGRALRGKLGKPGDTNVTDGFLDRRPTQTPTIGCPIGRARSGNRQNSLAVFYLCYPCNPW